MRPVYVLLLLVLGLAAFLRLADVKDKPRWYSDELFNLKVVQDLMHGELRIRAVSWTGFSPFHPYPLGYHVAGAVFCGALGDSLWTLRFMCGLLGVGVTLLVFLVAREALDERSGLIAAAAYAVHPKVVLFTRMAFPQNLAPLFVMASLYAALRYWQGAEEGQPGSRPAASGDLRRLALFSLAVGCALVSIYWAGALLLFLAGVVLSRQPRRVPLALGLALVPIVLQFLAVLWVQGPGPVFYDLRHLLGTRIGVSDAPGSGFAGSVLEIGKGAYAVVIRDPVFLLGLFGLGLLPRRRDAKALAAALALLSLPPLAQRGALVADFFYTAVLFAPIPFVGFGALFGRLLRSLENLGGKPAPPRARWGMPVLVMAAIAAASFLSLHRTVDMSRWPGEWRTKLDEFRLTVEDRRDAEAAARFINQNTSPDDFVIATPSLPALVHCRCTGVHQMAARLPGGTIWYPPDLPESRFLYDISYHKAKFFVLDRLTLSFYITVRNCDEVLFRIHQAQWPEVARFGEFQIFQNPVLGSPAPGLGPAFRLPVPLQLRLAALLEARGQTEAAIRWYLRAASEWPKATRNQLEQMVKDHSDKPAARRALELIQSREATSP